MVICRNCQAEIIKEYGSDEVICQECCAVMTEENLQIDEFVLGNNGRVKLRTFVDKNYQNYKRIPEGMNVCFQMAQNACYKLGREAVYDDVKNMIKKVLRHKHFTHRRIENKKTIAACCIYLAFRARNHPVTFDDLQKYCSDAPNNYEHWKTQLVRHFPEFKKCDTKTSIDELLLRVATNLKFEKKLQKRAEEILKLAHNVWLTEGQKPETLVLASCYLAWVEEVPKERLKIKAAKFCHLHKIPEKTSTLSKGVTLLLRVLEQLVEQIPWYRADGDFKGLKIVFHLTDILSFQRVLISQTVKKLQESDENIQPVAGSKRPRINEASSYVIRKKMKLEKKKCEEDDENQHFEIPEGLDLMREELDDRDMDDEALKEYLKLPEDIIMSANIRELQDVMTS